RSQRLEDGTQTFDLSFVTADHEAVALGDAPDPTAGADIDIVETHGIEIPLATHVVLVVAVAAIDDRVALAEELRELADRGFRGIAGRHHDPHGARRRELRDEIGEPTRRRGAAGRRRGYRTRVAIVHDDRMTTFHEPGRHVRAHLPQPHHSQLHVCVISPVIASRSYRDRRDYPR